MVIRAVKKDDVQCIAAIHAAAWKLAFQGILSSQLLDGFGGSELEARWIEILERENRINLLLEENETPLGFIAFREQPGEEKSGEIIGIYVDPPNWRNGVGRTLIVEALKRMWKAGFESAYLWTMTDNEISNQFYIKEGFKKSAERRMSSRHNETFEESKYEKTLE